MRPRFIVGAAVGPALGGLTIAAGLGYPLPLWVGTLLVAALATAGLTRAAARSSALSRAEPRVSR
ncbi:hypothetical protein [Rhizohabitans arisaemae]|uniref:hypothetical protein n=1 Tax=Rhizohabitans arisaemae TaxID=2720610 RepID=UPI0024B1F113|nr:hypothetical protein [Rhizohabitans arisaemae]